MSPSLNTRILSQVHDFQTDHRLVFLKSKADKREKPLTHEKTEIVFILTSYNAKTEISLA